MSEILNSIPKEDFNKVAKKLHIGMDKAEIEAVLNQEGIKLNNEQIDALAKVADSKLSEEELMKVSGGSCGGCSGGGTSKDDWN